MKLVYRRHAIERMFERRILPEQVRAVIEHGEVIDDRPSDTPYPSRLILGHAGDRPLHVAAAYNVEADEWIVITAYEPDLTRWLPGFRRKRS